jgi:hypothetical protein
VHGAGDLVAADESGAFPEQHRKKTHVMEGGPLLGIVNRSNVT